MQVSLFRFTFLGEKESKNGYRNAVFHTCSNISEHKKLQVKSTSVQKTVDDITIAREKLTSDDVELLDHFLSV